MASAVSTASLYPVVHEIDEEEYGTCCCIDGTVMGRFALQAFPLPASNETPQRTQSDLSNNSTKSAKRSKRRRSALQRARSEGALIDASDTQTISTDLSTEAEDKKFAGAFVLTRQIFRCQSSMLWECVHRESGQRYCVKIFDRRRLSVKEQEAVEREIGLFQNAQGNAGIVQVLDVIDESEKVYLIMEHMTGGNLLTKVVQQEGKLCESTVKLIAKSLLSGVRHLHGLEICHNGLEPSNILLDVTDSAKIGDFGHATPLGYMARTPGTAAYMAPEVLQGDAPTAASDMWSIGVLLYFCLFGQTPFADQSASGRTIVSRIHKAEYSFPTTEWDHVPRYAKQLISSLIHSDPTVRLTADEALQHPWFADPVVDPALHYRRPRRIRIFVQGLWKKVSLCRKKDDVKVLTLASLSTNSSSPFSSEQSIKHGHRPDESSSSMNRFYDIDG